MKPDSQQAADAAELGLDQTVLANERTYAAWIRTGLTSLAAGLAIERFMPGVAPSYSIRSIATLLISSALIIAALIALIGIWSLGIPTSPIVD